MRFLFIGLFFALTSAGLASGDHGCNADRRLSEVITGVHIAKSTRLAALIRLGSEKNICFGLEAPDPKMLTETVHVNSSRITIEAAIRQLLPDPASYEFSEQNGVILIRRGDFGTWLDHNVSFVVGRTTVQWASMSLFMEVARLADPSIGGFAGDYNPGNANDLVGPVNEQNKSLRELLTLIVSRSRGGAWISGRCAVTDESISHEPCWTILEYDLPRESTVAKAIAFLKKASLRANAQPLRAAPQAANGTSETKSREAPFELTVAIEERKYKPMTPIVSKISLRNISQTVLLLDETAPEWDYKVELLDGNRKTPALTDHGQTIPLDWAGRWSYEFRRIRTKLKPGESVDTKIDLSDIHVIQHPGTYSVRVSRALPPAGDQASASAESNVATFTVE